MTAGAFGLREGDAPRRLSIRMSPRRRLAAATVAAGLCALSLVRLGTGFEGIAGGFFAAVLVVLAAVDIERHVLPNRILGPAIAILAAAELAHDPHGGVRRLLWAAALFGGALLLALVYPAGLGMGDVKLAFFLGLGLGRSALPALLLGTVAAGIFGIVVLVRYGRAGRKLALPFGPFLAAGALVALLAAGPN